jgi:hypothetical protein
MKGDTFSLVIVGSLTAFLCVCALVLGYFKLCNERDTFNKFKSPSTPEATLMDAWSTELRVEAK